MFALDSSGRRIKQLGDGLAWEKWIPPSAKVRAELDGNLTVVGPGSLHALPSAKLSAGAIQVSYEGPDVRYPGAESCLLFLTARIFRMDTLLIR